MIDTCVSLKKGVYSKEEKRKGRGEVRGQGDYSCAVCKLGAAGLAAGGARGIAHHGRTSLSSDSTARWLLRCDRFDDATRANGGSGLVSAEKSTDPLDFLWDVLGLGDVRSLRCLMEEVGGWVRCVRLDYGRPHC